MADHIRWGVAGPGSIARQFARSMALVPDGEIVAVGSRSLDRASAFAAEFDVARVHGSYAALAADDDVDAVYVATLPTSHRDLTILFLEHGKHVLCEKPFALSEAQGREMAASARAHGRFLMEAIWSRFLPAYQRLGELLADGAIGRPLLVEADFGFRRPTDPTNRHFDLVNGGGALLDLGIYPVQLAALVLGPPDAVSARGHLGETGVDEAVAAVLHHPDGALAVVKAALNTAMTCTARIAGTDGSIELPAFMHCPDRVVVQTLAGREEHLAPIKGDGLQYEVLEVHRCLAAGLVESPTMSLDATLGIAHTLDRIRADIGLVYPTEPAP